MFDFIKENRWFLSVAILFLGVVWFASATIPYGTEIIDLNDIRHEPWNSIFIFWTKLGEEKVWVLAIVGFAFFKSYRTSLLALLVGGIVMASSFLAKTVIETALLPSGKR